MDTVDVILLKDIPKFGARGDVRTAKRGYAQNYLVAKGFAVLATPQQIAEIEKHVVSVERKEQRSRDRGRAALQKIAGKVFSLSARASESGTLYAGVGPKEIAKVLEDAGYVIPVDAIKAVHLKTVGTYAVAVQTAGVESVTFTLNIRASPLDKGGMKGG